MKEILAILLSLLVFHSSRKDNIQNTQLQVDVNGFKNNNGLVILAVFDSKDGFPMKVEKSMKRFKSTIKNGTSSFKISDLMAGEYAFAIIHDENANSKLDLNFLGIPKEGVAASNNATGFLSPPKYKDAKFSFNNKRITMKIKMIYL